MKRPVRILLNRYVRPRLLRAAAEDFPPGLRPRWTLDHPHPIIAATITRRRDAYAELLRQFAPLMAKFSSAPRPHWGNGMFDSLDAAALYGLLILKRPRCYLEIGSGHSTLFARQAIQDGSLPTRIVSVDPAPRAEVNEICDEVIRQRAEDLDGAFFDRLAPGDMLFVDGSHRALMNSDCVATLLDVLPRLPPGIIVHVHDIFLPYDYPQWWGEIRYSEHYVLAAYLLGGGLLDVSLPNAFISVDPQMRPLVEALWASPEMAKVGGLLGVTPYLGSSFWCEVKDRREQSPAPQWARALPGPPGLRRHDLMARAPDPGHRQEAGDHLLRRADHGLDPIMNDVINKLIVAGLRFSHLRQGVRDILSLAIAGAPCRRAGPGIKAEDRRRRARSS